MSGSSHLVAVAFNSSFTSPARATEHHPSGYSLGERFDGTLDILTGAESSRSEPSFCDLGIQIRTNGRRTLTIGHVNN